MGEREAPHRAALGQMLRRYRQACGMSQEELSERAGVAVRTICDLERGRTARPYRQTVGLLAEALSLRGPQRDEFVRLARQREEPMPLALADRTALEAAAGQRGAAMVPRQLPATVRHFTGRATELDALTGMLGQGDGPETVVISAVAGTAGVGKTALAIRWAHQVADQFPDGQLYVNLRGYDPLQPVTAADALAGFLRTLGATGTDVPDEAEDRARLYRGRLAGRRVLVVLDNARDGEQVRPLLPGAPGCAAIVTSRDQLAGLVATNGARRLDLDLLPLDDAIALLRSLVGPRADEDPEAAIELARLCARLPLALRIAAELAATRPEAPLADLVSELAASRLEGLDAGEERADVRTVFSWSVRQLPEEVATAFALVGLYPGENLDAYACAALTGTSVGQARKVLGRLHRASLLQAIGPGHYGMHDLLRAYAREPVTARDADGQCQRALTGLFDYYLAAAGAAMDIVFPAEAHRRPHVPPSAAAVPAMASEADARAWLDAERANLVGVVAHGAGHGWHWHATSLAGTLFRYLISGSHLPEALTVYGHALQAARLSGDAPGEAEALNGLGGIRMAKGHFRDAAGHYRAALESYCRCGDRAGQARVLYNLGCTEYELHNHRPADVYFREAIAAYEEAGDRLGLAVAQVGLSGVEVELGSYDHAAEHLRLALSVFRAQRHQSREAESLTRMGELSLRQGEPSAAAACYEQALAIFRRIDHPRGVGGVLHSLGEVSLRQGDYEQAVSYFRQALVHVRKTGDQSGEAITLRRLAGALDGVGQPTAARAELRTAIRLYAETGNTYELAGGHRELGDNYHSAGQDEQARQHWQQALDLYTQLSAPEAEQVRSRLSG